MLLWGCSRLLREECRCCLGGSFNSDFEIDELVCEGGHGVGETERIATRRLCGEHEVALSLFLAGENWLVVGADYIVVDVEGAARLDLDTISPKAQTGVLTRRQAERIVRALGFERESSAGAGPLRLTAK